MITVYTQPDCRPCKRVISKFDQANVPIKIVDISRDRDARDYVISDLEAKSTPVVESDDEVIVGYQPELVRRMIERYIGGPA